MMKINGLELIHLDSSVKSFSGIAHNDLLETVEKYFPENAFVVAYLDYTVLIGTWEKKQFHFYDDEILDPKYIQKLRVFNNDMELFIWRSSGGLRGRLRKDDKSGSGIEAVVADQLLFGTDKGNRSNASYTEIIEERGTALMLPFTDLKLDNKNRIFIRTHNYIEYNKVNQATYIDCRFVNFNDGNTDLT